MEKVSTKDNPADMFTKPVSSAKFQHFLDLASVGKVKEVICRS